MQLTREETKKREEEGDTSLMNSNNPNAPHCCLSAAANQVMKRTKSDIIPNLMIVNVHSSRALE